MVAAAIAANLGAILLSAIYLGNNRPSILLWIAGFFLTAFMFEKALRVVTGRVVVKRTPLRGA